jgi:hypothetical protein
MESSRLRRTRGGHVRVMALSSGFRGYRVTLVVGLVGPWPPQLGQGPSARPWRSVSRQESGSRFLTRGNTEVFTHLDHTQAAASDAIIPFTQPKRRAA